MFCNYKSSSFNQVGRSTSNLLDLLHGGRPRDEEPHVKRSTAKKKEGVEYIVRVDLVGTQEILKFKNVH